MPFVAVHAPFTLFKVHGVARQIPMHDRMTVRMKVESFLPY
jgi:hypothetical protein